MENKEQTLFNKFFRLDIDIKKGQDKCMRLTKDEISIISKALFKLDGVSIDEAEKAYEEVQEQIKERNEKFEEENPELFKDLPPWR